MQKKQFIPSSGYFKVKVIARQSTAEVRGVMDDGTIKIAVRADRKQGKANRELIAFLAKELELPKDRIRIASGITSPIKVISILEA